MMSAGQPQTAPAEPTEIEGIWTLPKIAKQFGVSLRQAAYAVERFGISPAAKLGAVRLYGPSERRMIRSAIERIASKRS